MERESLIDRREVDELLFALYDIRIDVDRIRTLLEEDDGEEAEADA